MRHQPQIAVWEVWVEHLSFKRWVLETQDEYLGRQRRWGLKFGQTMSDPLVIFLPKMFWMSLSLIQVQKAEIRYFSLFFFFLTSF